MNTAFDLTLGRTVAVREIKHGQVPISDTFICNEQCSIKLVPCCCTPERLYVREPHFKTSKGATHSDECSYIKKTMASATGLSDSPIGSIDNRKIVITFGEQAKKIKAITTRVDNNLPKTSKISRTSRANGVRIYEKEIKFDFKEVCNDFLADKLDERLTNRVVELTKESVDKCKNNECMIFYGKCKTLITPIKEGKNRYISFYLNDNQFAFSILKELNMSDDEFDQIFNKYFKYKKMVFIGISKFSYDWNEKIKKFCLKHGLKVDQVYCQ